MSCYMAMYPQKLNGSLGTHFFPSLGLRLTSYSAPCCDIDGYRCHTSRPLSTDGINVPIAAPMELSPPYLFIMSHHPWNHRLRTHLLCSTTHTSDVVLYGYKDTRQPRPLFVSQIDQAYDHVPRTRPSHTAPCLQRPRVQPQDCRTTGRRCSFGLLRLKEYRLTLIYSFQYHHYWLENRRVCENQGR